MRVHLHRAVVPVGTAAHGGRQSDRHDRDRRHASAGGCDAVRERIRASLRRRLRGQPDPGVPRQRAGTRAAQPAAGARRDPDADRRGPAHVSLDARERAAATRGHLGPAGRKRDAARAHGNGRRRPARQPAGLGAGEGLVPHARAGADRGHGHVRAAPSRARERRGARRATRRPDRARRPAGRAGHGARRSLARPGVLVPGRGTLRDRRRATGGGAGRRQRSRLDVGRARRHPDRDAAARPGARVQLGARAVRVRRGGPRARERAAPGGAARAAWSS